MTRGEVSAIPVRPEPVNPDPLPRKEIPNSDLIRPGQVIPGAGPGGKDYVVQPGDTLSGIRRGQYATPGQSGLSKGVEDLAQRNKLVDPNKIMPGQRLQMPDGSEYTVKRGDTLYGIERRFRQGQTPSQPVAPSREPVDQEDLRPDLRNPTRPAPAPTTPELQPERRPAPAPTTPELQPERRPAPAPTTPELQPERRPAPAPTTAAEPVRPTPPEGARGVPVAPDAEPGWEERARQIDLDRARIDAARERARTAPNVSRATVPPDTTSITAAPPSRSAPTDAEWEAALERSRRLQALQSVAGERGPTRPQPTPSSQSQEPSANILPSMKPGEFSRRMVPNQRRGRGRNVLPAVRETKTAWQRSLKEYYQFLEYENKQDPNQQTTSPKPSAADPEQQKKAREQTVDIATAKSTMSGLKNILGPDVDTNTAAMAAVKMSDGEPLSGPEQQAISALTPFIAKAVETPQVATSLKTALSTASTLAKKGMA